MNREGLTFGSRFEKKFIVNRIALTDYLAQNELDFYQKFDTDHYDKKSKFTLVHNIYFDSPHLNSYHDSLLKAPHRLKMRIRSYAQDGNSEEFLFLELKKKNQGETQKKRIAFRKEWLDPFLLSRNFIPIKDIVELNSHQRRGETLSIVDQLSFLVHQLQYRPVISSNYKRFAYKLKNSQKFRLTIDVDLTIKRLCPEIHTHLSYDNIISSSDAIVEVKYKQKESTSEILEKFSNLLGEGQSFSKYCFGVYQNRTCEDQMIIKNERKMAATI